MTKSQILLSIILSWIVFMVGSISLLGLATSISNQYPLIGISLACLYLIILYLYFGLLSKAITFYKNGK